MKMNRAAELTVWVSFVWVIADGDLLQGAVAVAGGDLALECDVDIGAGFELVDEVLAHAFLQVVATAEDRDRAGVGGEVHRGLRGGVAGADDVNVEAMGGRGFRACGAVVDPFADWRRSKPVGVHLPPADAARGGSSFWWRSRPRRPGGPGGSATSMREIERVTRISAPRPSGLGIRRGWRRVRRRRRRTGSRGSSSIRDEVPAWPPGASRSTTIVASPSDAPYTAAASPAGPAPTITAS